MYSLNLHFNKIFKGSARTVRDPFLSLREAYKRVLTVPFSSDMEALFHQENVIIFLLILALPNSGSSPAASVFGGINAAVSPGLSRIPSDRGRLNDSE